MDSFSFADFPPELIQETLFKITNPKDLLSFCGTNQKIKDICDDRFWHEKYKLDFWERQLLNPNNHSLPLLEEKTWRNRYLLSSEILDGNSPISTGFKHSGIIDDHGKLHMMGRNESGQLGNGTVTDSHQPIVVPFLSKVISLACGNQHTVAVLETGEVYYWGRVAFNYLKFPEERVVTFVVEKSVLTPELIKLPGRALRVIANGDNSGVILEDFTLCLWGYLGIGNKVSVLKSPTRIILQSVDLAFKDFSFSAVGIDRQLYFWGEKFFASGIEDTGEIIYDYIDHPTLIPLEVEIKRISMGEKFLVVLTLDGNVFVHGYGHVESCPGEYDEEDEEDEYEEIPSISSNFEFSNKISSIATGNSIIAVVDKIGKLYMWGNNLGDRIAPQHNIDLIDPIDIVKTPIEISIGYPIKYISIGRDTTIAVTEDKSVNLW
jgi:alpha-tubulin suppressor-like RCC1 family protein